MFHPDLVMDVGMHRGEDTAFYLAKGFRVVAIEANPQLCDAARTRFAEAIAAGRLVLINAAIVDTPGPVTFYVNDKVSAWSTVQPKWVQRNEAMGAPSHPITVEGLTFAEVLTRHGMPYYLKIDIEGNDMMCLEALLDRHERPSFVSIESDKLSWTGLRQEFALLAQLGYRRFKLVNQLLVPEQVPPSPPREGAAADYTFPPGATGLFGEEAPRRWLPRWLALLVYRWIFLKYRLVGNYGLLPNFHRRFKDRPRLQRLVHPGWYDTHAGR